MLNTVEKLQLFFSLILGRCLQNEYLRHKQLGRFPVCSSCSITGQLLIDNERALCAGDGQTNDSHTDNGTITQ